MRSLYIDPITKDLSVNSSYNLRFTSNVVEYVAQKIEAKLLFFKNEWYLNRSLGIPYIDETDRRDPTKNIFIKNPDIDFITNLFLIEINSITEVDQILKLDVDINTTTRTLIIDFEVVALEQTIQGTINL